MILVTHYSRTTVVDGLYEWRKDENRAVFKALGPDSNERLCWAVCVNLIQARVT